MTPPPRPIVRPFEKLSNFRDVGGHATSDGRRLKTGLLYRSDALHRMNDRDVIRLRAFDLQLICDLRSASESAKKPPRGLATLATRLANVPFHDDEKNRGMGRKVVGFMFARTGHEDFRTYIHEYYRHLVFDQTARVREVLTLLSQQENLPAVIHCNAGKDRTGVIAAIVQLLLGVPYETVRHEYLRTNEYFGRRLDRFVSIVRRVTLWTVPRARIDLVVRTHEEFLDAVYDAIVRTHGSVDAYVRDACGVDDETVLRLRSLLLD